MTTKSQIAEKQALRIKNLSKMNYKLTVTETGNKAGKYHYKVLDENGTLIFERKSNREYVACTISGKFYFGRLDLINKGDHARYTEYYRRGNMEKSLHGITNIAYK